MLYNFYNKYHVLQLNTQDQSDFKKTNRKHNYTLALIMFIEICTMLIFFVDEWVITAFDLIVIPYLCIIAFIANLGMFVTYFAWIDKKEKFPRWVRIVLMVAVLGISICVIYEFCIEIKKYTYMLEIQKLFANYV